MDMEPNLPHLLLYFSKTLALQTVRLLPPEFGHVEFITLPYTVNWCISRCPFRRAEISNSTTQDPSIMKIMFM